MVGYGFVKEIGAPFDEALKQVSEELKKEGFGVLTTIDLKEKFKEKLGVEFKRYVILGACHPPSAYQAVQTEENIGLLLPCNVVVYEKEGGTAVGIIKPLVAMNMVENNALRNIAEDVQARLQRVFDAVRGTA